MFIPTPPPQETPLPDVYVTAPRSELAATTSSARHTVLTAEDLRRTGMRSLPEMIGRAGDLWVQETNLGGGAPVIRGLMGNQILIVVDGVRLNDSTTRFGPNQSLNTIDPAIVDRVEIYRGPGSVLYGSDAIGGVILIWTKRALPAGVTGPGSDKGMGGFFEAQGNTAYMGGRGALGVDYVSERTGLLGIVGGGVFDDLESGSGEVPFTGYDRFSAFGSWDQMIEPGRVLRITSRMNRDFDVPRTDRLIVGYGQTVPNSEVWHFALQDRRGTMLSYTDTAENGFFDQFQTRLSFRQYTEERRRQSTGSTTFREEVDEVDTIGLGADWRKAVGDHQLFTFGVDFNYDDVDSTRTDRDLGTGVVTPRDGQFAPDSEYAALGVFLQDEIFAFDPFLLTAGLRWSYYDFSFTEFGTTTEESGNFDALTASLEASRRVGDWNFTAGIAQGFRAPNLDDLAKDGAFASGTELHNPNLDPETSITADLGAEYAAGQWTGQAGVYATRIEDLVGRVLVDPGTPPPGDETYLRENVGRLDIWGVEVGGSYRLAEQSPWSVGGRLAYNEGTQIGDGVTPGYEVDARRVPPLHGRASLKWDDVSAERRWFGWADFSVIFAAKQDKLHPQDVSDPRIDPNGTAGWVTLNLDVGGPIDESSEWWAGVHNILDEDYRVHSSGFDAPGIGLVLGLRISR